MKLKKTFSSVAILSIEGEKLSVLQTVKNGNQIRITHCWEGNLEIPANTDPKVQGELIAKKLRERKIRVSDVIFTIPRAARAGKEKTTMLQVLVIDGQGGGIGRQLVQAIKAACPSAAITAVGTNSAATAAMLRAGADSAATGENAVLVGCRRADVIAGPLGIVIADALLGEITPAMAAAVGSSPAKRVLVPVNHCDNLVVGVADAPLAQLAQEAARRVAEFSR